MEDKLRIEILTKVKQIILSYDSKGLCRAFEIATGRIEWLNFINDQDSLLVSYLTIFFPGFVSICEKYNASINNYWWWDPDN